MGLGYNPKQVSHTVEEGKDKPRRAQPKKRWHTSGIIDPPPDEQLPTKRPKSTAEAEQAAVGVENSFINDLVESGDYFNFDENFDVEGFYGPS